MKNQKLFDQESINRSTGGLLDSSAQNEPTQVNDQANKQYIRPRPFPHKHNVECAYDFVCHENECRILQKLVCSECSNFVHPNHAIDSLDWYINHMREKIKRKEGAFKTLEYECKQLINEQRKKRMKYLKYLVKTLKKIEKECRAIEDFALQKINVSMSSKSRKEAFHKFIQTVRKVQHSKLQELSKAHPEFQVKQEEEQQNIQDPNLRSEAIQQMIMIVDEMFMADEREREKIMNSRRSPSPQRTIRQLRHLGEKWERNHHRNAGATKRFAKKMLMESRMSIRNDLGIKKQVIDVDLRLEDDEYAPKVLQILPLTSNLLLTVHPNEIRLWKYNSTTYQDFKPITNLKLVDLKHVCVAEDRGEFLLLHGQQEVWAINSRHTGAISRIYQCPLPELRLSRLLVSGCQQFLYASGGCNQNGFYILCWGYCKGNLIRVMRHQFSFPHEGDLLTSYANQHIFRCNRNSIDVFNVIEGNKIQSIVLSSLRDFIEQATILRDFRESDSLCISTNKGSFYIYSYDDTVQENNYKQAHCLNQGTIAIYHVFYQSGLAEEGFFLAILENNETKVVFADLNNKYLFRGVQFSDQVLCGRLDYQRNPWINQLVLILGFESGNLRVLKFIKT